MKVKMAYCAWAAQAVLLLAAAACGKDGASPAGGNATGRGVRMPMQFPVETLRVQDRAVTTTLNAVGSVEAFEKVQVTARVAGVVEKVQFAEGSRVTGGQVLVEIEPQRYTLAVESAQAAHNKAAAAKSDAEAGLKRRETVDRQNPGLIPGEEIETWRTKVLVAAAEMAQSGALLNQARLNLHDAYVRAPVPGVVQTRTVQTGQYVQPGSVLATLVRRDPLLLRFQATEQDAPRLQPGMKAFFKVRDRGRDFQAKIIHVAASADDSTRMVAVTAQVVDPARETLRSGSFAEVTVPVGNARPLPVVPQTAIRPSEKGFLAFVVENGRAVERILTPGMRTADGYVEVLAGLKAGELLVVRGAEALSDGVAVHVAKGKAAAKPVR
ncbi:MAG: efflux RND transporter periplasmic adaptor subunit [Acidobacteria bacterium]|jgi:multidrug efflux system membrane fusion protein|nr:efflux RND transporter periplasmic adaptor subunit [Acidobacteriota bacterium]